MPGPPPDKIRVMSDQHHRNRQRANQVESKMSLNKMGSGAYGPSGSRAEPWPSFFAQRLSRLSPIHISAHDLRHLPIGHDPPMVQPDRPRAPLRDRLVLVRR